MSIERDTFNNLLENIVKDLDISPTKYKTAVSRYESVAAWLNDDETAPESEVCIYPQGSFRLGTVVRPIREQLEKDYDIDLVCEYAESPDFTTPKSIKHRVGNRLKQHKVYKEMLDKEGKRCWTLLYAEQDGAGFHLDVLPSASLAANEFPPISITHQDNNTYSWRSSNPKGYALWFEEKNKAAFNLVVNKQKSLIFNSYSESYASVEEVPDQLIRTPLQRSIQLMKRHRDMRFNDDSKYAPISMIITTLAAHLYNGEQDILTALTNIVSQFDEHNCLLVNKGLVNTSLSSRRLIRKLPDGTWYIGNPTNPDENFADRWHEDGNARAKAFFKWVSWLKRDFLMFASRDENTLKFTMEACFGESAISKAWSNCIPVTTRPTPNAVHISEAPKPWRKNA